MQLEMKTRDIICVIRMEAKRERPSGQPSQNHGRLHIWWEIGHELPPCLLSQAVVSSIDGGGHKALNGLWALLADGLGDVQVHDASVARQRGAHKTLAGLPDYVRGGEGATGACEACAESCLANGVQWGHFDVGGVTVSLWVFAGN